MYMCMVVVYKMADFFFKKVLDFVLEESYHG